MQISPLANRIMLLKPIWTIVWKVLLFFMVWGSMLAVVFVPMSSTLLQWGKTQPALARLYPDLVSLLTIIVATWFIIRFVDKQRFYSILFISKNLLRDFSLGLSIGTAWLGVSLVIAALAGWVQYDSSFTISWASLYIAGVAVMLNIMTQQLLLNGYIFQTIKSHTSPLVAVVASSILFSGYHFGAFHGMLLPAINVFAAGLLFCIASQASGNLWFPIGIHFAWNFSLGPLLGLTVSGTNRLGSGWQIFSLQGPGVFTGGSFGLEGGLIVTFTAGVGILFLIFYRSRQKAI
jgi:uncharacterized protein